MKNKKGFTLVELLSVIVLISLLLGLGIPGISRISKNMKERSYKTKVNLIEQAAVLWGQDNKTRLQTDICDIDEDSTTGEEGKESNCHIISTSELISEDYLTADIDENISDTCVWVYRKNNRVYAYYPKNDTSCLEQPGETPENDEEKPVIKDYKIENYDVNYSYATVSATIEDNKSLSGYLFTEESECPSYGYESISGTSKTITKTFNSTYDGNYYLCVKDTSNNIEKQSIYIANCIIDASYTCFGSEMGAEYSFKIKSNSNDNENLEVKASMYSIKFPVTNMHFKTFTQFILGETCKSYKHFLVQYNSMPCYYVWINRS